MYLSVDLPIEYEQTRQPPVHLSLIIVAAYVSDDYSDVIWYTLQNIQIQIPSWELKNPPPSHIWRWFSFS